MEDYSIRWRAACFALDNNQIPLAILELEKLYAMRDKLAPELRGEVIYSYGVALSIANRPFEAIEILTKFRETNGEGSSRYVPKDIASELSSAYMSIGDFFQALIEAELAVQLSLEGYDPDPIAFLNKGIAEYNLGNLNNAKEDLLKALKIACERRKITTAGVIAEHLGRLEILFGSADNAYAWAVYAERIYLKYAPHHLASVRELQLRAIQLGKGNINSANLLQDAQLLEDLLNITANISKQSSLDALDIDLYMFLKGMMSDHEEYFIQIPTGAESIKSKNLEPNLVSDILAINNHELYPSIVKDSFLARYFKITSDFPSIQSIKLSRITPSSTDESLRQLTWTNPAPWPWGFAITLFSLSSLYLAGLKNLTDLQENYIESNWEPPSIISFSPRTWPRWIQMRYLSLGEFESGLVLAPAHLMEDFTREAVIDEKKNMLNFRDIGYTESEATSMTKGGLIAIRASAVSSALNNMEIPSLGGLVIDEINPANLPEEGVLDIKSLPKEDLRYGLFVDRYYQTIFWARAPKDYGLYGSRNDLFRDHYDQFRKTVNVISSTRVKHYAVPIIEVNNLEEIRDIVKRFPRFPDTNIFFRGQTRLYTLQRPSIVKKMLFSSDDVVEPSLLGAAPRRNLDYNLAHSALQLLVQDFLYEEAVNLGKHLENLHEEWFELAGSATASWDISIMALGQHYGIPTHGLDITSNLEVAVWFATHRFLSQEDGTALYESIKIDEWGEDPNSWPVILIIQTITNSIKPSIHNIQSLERLGLHALRPERQSALFFMGAHTIHSNRLAEAVACIIRLRPGSYETGINYEYLFPSTNEDPAYRLMLCLRDRYSSGPLGQFFKEIVRYKHDSI